MSSTGSSRIDHRKSPRDIVSSRVSGCKQLWREHDRIDFDVLRSHYCSELVRGIAGVIQVDQRTLEVACPVTLLEQAINSIESCLLARDLLSQGGP